MKKLLAILSGPLTIIGLIAIIQLCVSFPGLMFTGMMLVLLVMYCYLTYTIVSCRLQRKDYKDD